MPVLNVRVSGPRRPQVVADISALLLNLTEDILHKKRALTAILVQFVDADDWTIGGKRLSELQQSSVYFDIEITDETNTKDEKAAYIRAAFDGLRAILGDLSDESYIRVDDARAGAYGYGGETQEWRYQHS